MDLAFELHDLVRTLDKHAEHILKPEGLSYNRYVALVIVNEHPGITGRALAGALGVTEAAASGIVRALLGADYIQDLATVGQGNIRKLGPTPTGVSTLARCSALLGSSFDDNARAIDVDPRALARTIRALHDEVRSTQGHADTSDTKEIQ